MARREIKGGGPITDIVVMQWRTMQRSALSIAFCAAILSPPVAGAQQPVIPAPTGLVNDFAGVLDAATIGRIERIAEDVRTKSRGEMAIVTMRDLEGREPADIALRIGREWKVGKLGDPGDPTRNAGAVILLVPKETNSDGRGRCFIATGQGTEGFITDFTAASICREATPAFMARDYATGLELVTLRTAERFASEFGFSLDTGLVPPAPVRVERPAQRRGISPSTLFIIFFIVMMLLSRGSRGRGRRGRRDGCGGGVPLIIPMGGGGWHSGGGGWGGGGFGGGFGGFGGGGGFSGGGGGSSW